MRRGPLKKKCIFLAVYAKTLKYEPFQAIVKEKKDSRHQQ